MAMAGWGAPFKPRPWSEVRDFLAALNLPATSGYVLEIVDSVLAHGADEVLAVITSMHDLLVTPYPVGEPPLDVVAVRAPGSLRPHPPDTVLIEHLAVAGEGTSIERSSDEALVLFWRFMRVEFGIAPAR